MKNPNRTRRVRRHNVTMEQTTDSSDFVNGSVVLGGINRKCVSQQFRGGDITLFMGGGKIDLREARIQGNEAVLDIFTLIGGIELLVPRDWVVEPRFSPVLGGFEDRTTPEKKEGSTPQRLAIQGTMILSGITVSN
jgi:predicted membrane protein